MLERSSLSDAALADCLRVQYGIDITGIDFLPLGMDYNAWSYRAEAGNGRCYFVKVRRGEARRRSVVLPRFLYDSGLAEVIAAEKTRNHQLWVEFEGFTATVAPFVEPDEDIDPLGGRHWIALGKAVRKLHSTALPADLVPQLGLEMFVPDWLDTLPAMLAEARVRSYRDSYRQMMAAELRAHQAEIEALLAQARTLGGRLRGSPPPFVLCHSDLHIYNFMVDKHGRLFIVDWDEATLAPKERDLMFVIGGISDAMMSPRGEQLFFEGYGPTGVDPLALSYYRTAWAVQDIGEFSSSVMLRDDTSEATRRQSIEGFKVLFKLGEIVDRAFQRAY